MGSRSILYIAIAILATAFVFNAGATGYWLFVIICGYYLLQLMLWIRRTYRNHRILSPVSGREYAIKLTAGFMGLFFISGTVLYTFAFQAVHMADGTYLVNNAELIIRSLICSLDMFMLDVDSNILDRLDSYPLLKGAIVTQAALSFMCTIALLVSLIFSRARAYYYLHYKTKVTAEKNHLYIFFGLNENTKLLAKDIHTKDHKAITVLVDEANFKKDDENDSWENIVSLFTHRQKTFEFADDSKALVAIASKQPYDIDVDKLRKENLDLLSLLELRQVRDFILSLNQFPDDSQLHLFFLSDNEENNIRSIINLAKDKTILDIANNSPVETCIYCHARYNGPNRVVEDLAIRKGLKVEIIDSSHLAVELLKSTRSDQPVRVAYLSKTHPTTVTRPINSLIIGFGEVGRDSFRFIYEFGTFIKEGTLWELSPRITAIDSKMHELDGTFMANAPAINFNSDGIRLEQIDCHSAEFYNHILTPQQCRELNYIVLALGDDDQNIALASTIFTRIRRYREDMSHLIIMVRCIKDEKRELMAKIAEHYNRGCEKDDLNVIRLFGNPKEIYSYNTIIKDTLTRKGITFMENYQRLNGESGSWKSRREKLTGLKERREGKEVLPQVDNLRKLRRQESQDLANALHSDTKLWLLQEALGADYDWEGFVRRMFASDGSVLMTGEKEHIHFPHLSPLENTIMLHLSMLEHARWNAAHRLLGYERTGGNQCDERTMRHNCLIDWDELDQASVKASSPTWQCDYKVYDFSVVNTSIAISGSSLGKLNEK